MNGRANILSSQYPLVVGILRGFSPELIEPVADVYARAGFSFLEITLNSPQALETISHLQSYPSLMVGAGTVCNMSDLERALSAGARFIVSPVLDEEMIRHCSEIEIPVFPGAFTPTEIYRAWEAGATMVKVFPAGLLGPGYIREVLAPLSQVALMPTGGIHSDNVEAYIQAGAKGFGMGSHLFPAKLIHEQKWEDLLQHMLHFRGKITGIADDEVI